MKIGNYDTRVVSQKVVMGFENIRVRGGLSTLALKVFSLAFGAGVFIFSALRSRPIRIPASILMMANVGMVTFMKLCYDASRGLHFSLQAAEQVRQKRVYIAPGVVNPALSVEELIRLANVRKGSFEAILLLKAAADKNDGQACYLLGEIFRDGRCEVEANHDVAIGYYFNSIRCGYFLAYQDLATMYLFTVDQRPRCVLAVAYLLEALDVSSRPDFKGEPMIAMPVKGNEGAFKLLRSREDVKTYMLQNFNYAVRE